MSTRVRTIGPTVDKLVTDCDTYLAARTGRYEYRRVRYNSVISIMAISDQKLTDDDIVVDWGAGGTELGYCLYNEWGWRGRYWPIDGWQGVDLRGYTLPRQVDWIVACEVLEHVNSHWVEHFLAMARRCVTKGFVLTTPNPSTVDVLGMDDTHVFPIYEHWLNARGVRTKTASLYGKHQDSIIGVWTQ